MEAIPSQKTRILDQLRLWGEDGVCATSLLAQRIPRYAARIKELRNEGYQIETVTCVFHSHQSRQVRYVLIRGVHVGQLTMDVS